jgi:AraC family transcriptional regulator
VPDSIQLLKLGAAPMEDMHDNQRIVMMLQPGTVEVSTGRTSVERFNYKAGDVALCRRHIVSSVRSEDNIQVFSFEISDLFLGEAAGKITEEIQLQSIPNLDDLRLRALMMAANAERVAGFPSGRLFLESVEMALATILVERYTPYKRPEYRHRGGLTPSSLRHVTEFIRSRIGEDVSLFEMAETVGLSVNHFSRLLRQSIGESPHQFVLQQRVQHAKELLSERDLRMIDVALACGFKTQQHFARVFRKIYGTSPTEYRQHKLNSKTVGISVPDARSAVTTQAL